MKRIFCWERSTGDLTFTGRQLIEIVGNFARIWNYIFHLQVFKKTHELKRMRLGRAQENDEY
jgi:hypothetical protein